MDRMLCWSRDNPRLIDATLAAVVLLVGLAGPDLVTVGTRAALAIGLAVPLVWRRRAPCAVFAIVVIVGFAQYATGTRPTPADVAILVSLYTVAVRCRRRDTIVATGIVALGSVLAALRWSDHSLGTAGLLGALTLTAVLSGETLRARRAYLGALEARAAQLEHERDEQAVIAVAAERSRIARELHDIVAHNVSVMIAQADGAQYALDTDPDRAREAIGVIARTGRDALTEMRHIVGVLRPSDFTEDTEPQPSAARIADLVERLAATGYAVNLVVHGSPAAIPAGPGLAAYRIVQESLTNTFKHAGSDARATVTLTFVHDGLRVRIDDDGPGPERRRANPRPGGAGHGLVGMKERVAMYDGSFQSGRRPNGGYFVEADLAVTSEVV